VINKSCGDQKGGGHERRGSESVVHKPSRQQQEKKPLEKTKKGPGAGGDTGFEAVRGKTCP